MPSCCFALWQVGSSQSLGQLADETNFLAVRHKASERLSVLQEHKGNVLIERPEDDTAIHDIYSALVTDARRNDAIIEDVEQALLKGRSPLLLTSRTEHPDYLAGRLRGICQHIFVLKGGMRTKQRKQITESLSRIGLNESRMILATGSYLGEGFDDARLDTLLLTMPISWRGTLQQYVGRLHRLHENKREVLVYDYADVLAPMLARMYKKRLAGYSALGYIVEGGPPA
jgi:superfamily II DNA or RNA helicase